MSTTYKLELCWQVKWLILAETLKVDNVRWMCLIFVVVIATTSTTLVLIVPILLSRVEPAFTVIIIASTFV